MSSSTTSAIRRLRKDLDALLTAAAAACSHDSVLVPTSSTIVYTLSAIGGPPYWRRPIAHFISDATLPSPCSKRRRASFPERSSILCGVGNDVLDAAERVPQSAHVVLDRIGGVRER